MKPLLRSLFGALVLFYPCSGWAQTLLFVSEYATGNLKAFDYSTGNSVTLPSGYTPVAGINTGADGMALGDDGRLFVNRGDGTISRRSADGNSFTTFVTISGVSELLDLTRNTSELFAARYNSNTIYRISLGNASVSTINGPAGATRFDGVRIGPDNRLYAVDSSDGDIFAYDLGTSTWTTFYSSSLSGDASQMEFGGDGRIFLSRTIAGQARIYSYTLNTPGNYTSGLDPSSQTLIGVFGNNTTATGIRIGPDGRLYANNFNDGEVWRSNIGITAMEASPFVTGLNQPGSLYFAAIPEPAGVSLLGLGGLLVLGWRLVAKRKAQNSTLKNSSLH